MRQHTILYNGRKEPKFVRMKEPKHAQSIVFLFIRGIHSRAMTRGRDSDRSSKFPEWKQIINEVGV